jgi:hypothetical protein
MDDDLESMWKEGVVACSRLNRHVQEPIRKNTDNDRSARKIGTSALSYDLVDVLMTD